MPGTVVGLRVDVDTYRGTRDGVPELLDIFKEYGISASIFFSVGPDNMGRHLWRLIRPKFLLKMLRSNAASLYGWDILLRGPLWPGPNIGRALSHVIKRAADSGHEVGLHAWDHHAWQMRLGKMAEAQINDAVSKGMRALQDITGSAPTCSAAAGWICNEAALRVKDQYPMRYNSDCRGHSIFQPVVDGVVRAPQVPVTLPTYDEIIGHDGVTDEIFNSTLLEEIKPEKLNVLTIHAEVEGIAKSALFREFLREAAQRRIRFVPLGDLLPAGEAIPQGRIMQGSLDGRDGTLCMQETT